MHDHPTPVESGDVLAHAILDLLVEEHPGLWSIAELERTLTPSTAFASAGTPATADAIETLHAAGLINRVGDFVFASRAAHTAQRLAG